MEDLFKQAAELICQEVVPIAELTFTTQKVLTITDLYLLCAQVIQFINRGGASTILLAT